jgi:capsule polysaccharide export protein KpsE/RkpR
MSESEETNKGVEEVVIEKKVLQKSLNLEAVAKLLTDMQDDDHKIMSDFVQMKNIISHATQDIAGLRAEINVLRVAGIRGDMGTASTVHKKDEEIPTEN